MATGAWPTIIDVANRQDAKGNIPTIAEMLSQANEMYEDAPMMEANERTGHMFVFRESLPPGSWRQYNMGVPAGKSTTAKSRVGIGMLEALSQVDLVLARHTGDPERFRESEDVAFLEGMSQTIAQTLLYGNTVQTPAEFMGLAPFYNTVNTASAANAANVIDGGGTGSSNTSLWFIGWGPNSMYCVYPAGSKAGLEMEDRGDTVPAYDALGNPYRAYTGWFSQQMAFVPQDWRFGARLCNIDVTNAGLAGPNVADIFAYMAQMQFLFPHTAKQASGITKTDAPMGDYGVRPVFYANRTTLHWMQIQAMRNKNVLLRLDDYAGKVTDNWRGYPVKCVDQILNTESRIV